MALQCCSHRETSKIWLSRALMRNVTSSPLPAAKLVETSPWSCSGALPCRSIGLWLPVVPSVRHKIDESAIRGRPMGEWSRGAMFDVDVRDTRDFFSLSSAAADENLLRGSILKQALAPHWRSLTRAQTSCQSHRRLTESIARACICVSMAEL